MNETTYNTIIFVKDYLEKAIDGIKNLAPKVWWYLEWKCYLQSIISALFLIPIILYWIWFYKLVKDKNSFYNYEYTENKFFSQIFLIVSIFIFISMLYNIIYSFTPICPIDKAIEIGETLIK